MGTTFNISIAELKVSADPNTQMIAHSLGSCIGVAIWDRTNRVGGLLHYLLSDSKRSPDKAKDTPAMFADTGIPLLFRSAYELGAVKRRLVIKVAGGASLFNSIAAMDIGKNNYIMLRKIFWKNGVLIDAEHIGGSFSRTMKLELANGRVTISNRTMGQIEI